MKSTLLLAGAALFFLATACSTEYEKAENATDAAREFVDAVLQGDHRKAYFYLLKDSTNELMFDTQKAAYNSLSSKDRESRKDASIRPIENLKVNDSVWTFRYYQTANPKDTTALRVVRVNGEWLVDLKSVIKI